MNKPPVYNIGIIQTAWGHFHEIDKIDPNAVIPFGKFLFACPCWNLVKHSRGKEHSKKVKKGKAWKKELYDKRLKELKGE